MIQIQVQLHCWVKKKSLILNEIKYDKLNIRSSFFGLTFEKNQGDRRNLFVCLFQIYVTVLWVVFISKGPFLRRILWKDFGKFLGVKGNQEIHNPLLSTFTDLSCDERQSTTPLLFPLSPIFSHQIVGGNRSDLHQTRTQ